MKILSCCMFVLVATLVLFAAPAVHAADMAPQILDVQPALVDAPLVDTLCPDEQPAFADFTAPEPAAVHCLDSGISCTSDQFCQQNVCPLCTCFWLSPWQGTCVLC